MPLGQAIQELLSAIGTLRWFRSSSLREMRVAERRSAPLSLQRISMRAVRSHRHRGLGERLAPAVVDPTTLARCSAAAVCTGARRNHVHQGNVAQRKEQAAHNCSVGGSIPPFATGKDRKVRGGSSPPCRCQQHLHRGTQVPRPKRPSDLRSQRVPRLVRRCSTRARLDEMCGRTSVRDTEARAMTAARSSAKDAR